MLREAEQRALSLLGDHRDALDRLVADLLVHESLDGDAVTAVLAGTEPPAGPAPSGGPLRQPQLQVRTAEAAPG